MRCFLKWPGSGYTAGQQLEINLSAGFYFPCFQVQAIPFADMFFSFTELQINIYFYWRNVCGRCDLVPKLKHAREHG